MTEAEGTDSGKSLSSRHQATTAVMEKIQQAMEMFGESHVGNLLLREGEPLEYETSINGIVSMVSFSDGTGADAVSQPLTRDEMSALFSVVASDWESKIHAGGIDGPVRFEDMGRYRAHIFLWGGEQLNYKDGFSGRMAAFIRIIPGDIKPLAELGLPSYMSVLGDANCGLLLVTGPTGSGKSTTLASYIDHINRTRVGHIVTIEDPIEYDLKQQYCRVTPREVGTNVKDLQTGVRDAMREIPLAILVGETRDTPTLIETMAASRSGHYVGTTRHAPNVVSAIRSLVDNHPGEPTATAAMVAETILGVIYQVRVPSTTDGQWEFAHECLNVTNNPRAQTLIASQDWNGLRGLIAGNEDEKRAQLLNTSLLKLILAKKITEAAADLKAYDRVHLRALISASKKGASV